MSKWSKRAYKAKGFLNHVYSLMLLRYAPLNNNYLKNFFSLHPVDRLHVGCGPFFIAGWCNIFYDQGQEYGRVKKMKDSLVLNYNLLKPWPWPESSVSFVAGAHFIEHLNINQCLKFCRMACKVLKPGGVLRLSCPDLEIYASNYVQGNEGFFAHQEIRKACAYNDAETSSQIFAAKAYDNNGTHKWFHDFSSLKNILQRSGFVNIRKVARLEGKMPDLPLLEIPQREIETVYVEAEKP